MLEALDGVASQTGAGMATMIYGVVDHSGGRVELFNVGHPPPLLVDPGGVAGYLKCDHFPPLGSASVAASRPPPPTSSLAPP